MAYTSAQIVTRAVAQAKAKGGTVAAGQYLNLVLQELCQTYDFDVARGTYVGNFNPNSTTTTNYPNNTPGSGPYPLPAQYLRCDPNESMWFLNGVPYPMVAVDLSEYDAKVQQAGMQSYPLIMATDLAASPPVFIVWPPASGTYTVMFRYRAQMPDIGSGVTFNWWNSGSQTPDISTTVPWFPQQNYLITRVAGEMAKEAGDTRWMELLGDRPHGAQGILERFLEMANDRSDRSTTIGLDGRKFSRNFQRLQNTKTIYY